MLDAEHDPSRQAHSVQNRTDKYEGRATMYIIGENIHIISEKVKEALSATRRQVLPGTGVKQVEAGAQALDLNLGPRKKDGEEVFPWMVETVEAVVDVPLSFDTTNLAGHRSRA